MGFINLYKGLGNDYEEIKGNGKIKDLAPDLDFNKTILLNKGHAVTPDFEIDDDTIILAREVPSDPVTLAIAGVTAISAYVIGGVAYGVSSYVTNKQISEAQEKAQRDAANLAQQINQFPFIKGAKNKSSIGTTISYQLGQMYDTPPLINDGFYTITDGNINNNEYGKNQYYNAVLTLGAGKKRIEKILIGDSVILENASGISSGNHSFKSDSVYYDAENFVDIRQAGESFENSLFKNKVVYTSDGSEIKHDYNEAAVPVIKQAGSYVKKLEVCIQFNGLRKYDNNNWEPQTATVKPYWSNDNGVTWNEFYFSDMTENSITLQTRNTVRFVATKEFTTSDVMEIVNGKVKHKEIMLKVEKTTQKAESNSNEDCYLLFYQTTQYEPNKSNLDGFVDCPMLSSDLNNKLTRIAIRLKATESTNNTLDDIHVISTALAPIYNGGAWTTQAATRNPAAQIYEVLTSDYHKHSKYTNQDFDLNTLGALYTYCEQNNFYCDKIITSQIKKVDLIKNILSTCGAAMIYNYEKGKLDFVIDKAETTPVALLNAEDLKSIGYTKDFSRKVDGVKVTYLNSDSWQIDTFYVMRNGGERTADSLLTEINLDYVTTYSHAYKLALRALKQIYLQPREIRANVGAQGDYYPLYSTVLVQYKEFRIGLGSSVITSITKTGSVITSFNIADEFTFESGKNYGAIIQAVSENGKRLIYVKVTQGENKKELNIVGTIASGVDPQVMNTVSIGELDSDGNFTKITNKMKIYGVEPDGSNGFILTLKDYNDSIYTYGSIPPYISNITRVPKPAQEVPNPDAKGLNGESGYNSRTITLYIRSESTPQDLPFSFTQYFSHNTLDATTQQLNGWSEGSPAVRDDHAPRWVIYQTQVSQLEAAEFKTSGWSTPVKDSQDADVTKSDIQDMINDLKETGAPNVYATRTFASVAVDENNIATATQDFDVTVQVLQSGEEVAFTFGNITAPSGWNITHIGKVLHFTVNKGAEVNSGNIDIPIIYRAWLSINVYSDENGDYYGDENGEVYGSDVYATDATVYNLGFGFAGIRGGRYLNAIYGKIDELNKIPIDVVIGDYFTWTGANTDSNKSLDGQFLKCAVYKWTGYIFEKTNDTRNLQPALNDILAENSADLEANNSEVVGFFKKVVSNEVVATNLTVTGTAFMNRIIANVVSANTFVSYVDSAKNTAITTAAADATSKANAAQNAAAADATSKANNAKEDAIEQAFIDMGFVDGDDVTIIQGGKIKTNFIKVDELLANDIKLKNILYSEDFDTSAIYKENYYRSLDKGLGSAIFNSKNANGAMVANTLYANTIMPRTQDDKGNYKLSFNSARVSFNGLMCYERTPAPLKTTNPTNFYTYMCSILRLAYNSWVEISGILVYRYGAAIFYEIDVKAVYLYYDPDGTAVHYIKIYARNGDYYEGRIHSSSQLCYIYSKNNTSIVDATFESANIIYI